MTNRPPAAGPIEPDDCHRCGKLPCGCYADLIVEAAIELGFGPEEWV